MGTDAKTRIQHWLLLSLIPLVVGCNTLVSAPNEMALDQPESDTSLLNNQNSADTGDTAVQDVAALDETNSNALALLEAETANDSTDSTQVDSVDSSFESLQSPENDHTPLMVTDPIAVADNEPLAAPNDITRCWEENSTVSEAYDAMFSGLAHIESALLNKLLESLEQDKTITKLQLALLEKEAQIQQLILEQQATVQEMVRAQAKLHSRNSRAETAALVAEATLTYKKAVAIAIASQQPTIDRAKQLLDHANEAFRSENYDSSAFLARQSLTSLHAILLQNSLQITQKSEYRVDQLFAIPLTMRVITTSNIRTSPSNLSNVLRTVEEGETVTATGYKGHWVQVEMAGDTEIIGWVFYDLLELSTLSVDSQ